MRVTTPHILMDIDHADERIHNIEMDDALYDAIAIRLRAAQERLEPTRPFDDETEQVWRHLEAMMGRLRAAKSRTEHYLEDDQFDRESSSKLHDLILDMADCAENLVRRFEAPGSRHEILSSIESSLTRFEKLLEESTPV